MNDKYDHTELYCPKLGHHLTFNYCRSENRGLPCSRVVTCCSDKIPIETYINDHLSNEEMEEVFNKPVNKMNSILQIVQKVSRENA